MQRLTEQQSRWFITDIMRHAHKVMDHQQTTVARLFVTDISKEEIGMLQKHFTSVSRDQTGHITLKST